MYLPLFWQARILARDISERCYDEKGVAVFIEHKELVIHLIERSPSSWERNETDREHKLARKIAKILTRRFKRPVEVQTRYYYNKWEWLIAFPVIVVH